MVLTVPQHPWLWSRTDDFAHHKRRYVRKELLDKVTRAGLRVDYVTSFVALLLPLMLVSRMLPKSGPGMDEQLDGAGTSGLWRPFRSRGFGKRRKNLPQTSRVSAGERAQRNAGNRRIDDCNVGGGAGTQQTGGENGAARESEFRE